VLRQNLQSQPGYERLEAYGFGVDYPSDCVIEFSPKSTRNKGDVALKSPRGYKLFLSWGELDKVKKLEGVEGHADYSIQRIKTSREADVADVRKDSRTVNGHRAAYRDVSLELVRRGIFFNKTKTPQRVRSMHVHCDVSSRFFVIYGPVSPERSDEQAGVVSMMIRNFACHPH
jgi:hypothetical protein